MKKQKTIWNDEETGMEGEVYEDGRVTLFNSRGGHEFVFKNSSVETLEKVANALLRFANLVPKAKKSVKTKKNA